jgi:hypothetical protein
MSNELTLANIGGGAAVEKFAEELDRVIENILDPNTEAKAKRKIVLEVCIAPNHERGFGAITISSVAKLAPTTAYATRAYFGRDADRHVCFEDNPRQLTIEDFVEQGKSIPAITPAEKKVQVG